MLLSGGHQARELLCLVSLEQPPATNTQVDVHLLWGPRDSHPQNQVPPGACPPTSSPGVGLGMTLGRS